MTNFKRIRLIEIAKVTATSMIAGMILGCSIGLTWGLHHNKSTTKVVVRPYGYTIIDYDSVEWSDGRRTKYDWHLYKDVAK